MMIQNALMCLALNIYHESRSESLEGQIAVAMVTMNRASWDTASVCDVVYERKQFSWTHRLEDFTPKEPIAWERARQLAQRVIEGRHDDITDGATHFHTRAVRPAWRHSLKKLKTIGGHVFYVQR